MDPLLHNISNVETVRILARGSFILQLRLRELFPGVSPFSRDHIDMCLCGSVTKGFLYPSNLE